MLKYQDLLYELRSFLIENGYKDVRYESLFYPELNIKGPGIIVSLKRSIIGIVPLDHKTWDLILIFPKERYPNRELVRIVISRYVRILSITKYLLPYKAPKITLIPFQNIMNPIFYDKKSLLNFIEKIEKIDKLMRMIDLYHTYILKLFNKEMVESEKNIMS
jgi:hypothetical protein